MAAGNDYDIVIAGGGTVAFAMAQRLRRATKKDGTALKVLVLESSSEAQPNGNVDDAGNPRRYIDTNEFISALDKGYYTDKSFHDPSRDYLTASRTRCYAGSTNCWGGWIRPLDSYDFDKWAMKRSALDGSDGEVPNYYAEALKLVELDHFELFDKPESWVDILKKRGFDRAVFEKDKLEPSGLKTVVIQQMADTKVMDFIRNEKLKEAFDPTKTPNIKLVRNATVVDLAYTGGSKVGVVKITGLTYRGLDRAGKPSNPEKVSADHFVLAMGGLEITRFLLNKQYTSDWLRGLSRIGKCYMNHPKYGPAARAWLALDSDWRKNDDKQLKFYSGTTPWNDKNGNVWAYIVPRETKKTGNFRVALGWEQAMHPELKREMWKVNIELNFEQMPNPSSRITVPPPDVSHPADAFGVFRLLLDWQFLQDDVNTFNTSLGMIRDWLARYDPAVAKDKSRWEQVSWSSKDKPPYSALDGVAMYTGDHHIGLIPMNSDDKTRRDGIVDSDLKFNTSDNLWVCSTAVYPTGGWANATFTLLAMALRLGDHLKKQFQ